MPRSRPLFDGASVRRVDIGEGVAAIEVRVPGESIVVILAIMPGARGVGIVSPEARRAAWGGRLPGGSTSRGPRALLEGGHVTALGTRSVTIVRENVVRVLGIEGAGVGLLRGEPAPERPYQEAERGDLEARGEALLAGAVAGAIVRRRDAVARAISRAIAKLDRRVKALTTDLSRIGDADAMASRAQWLVAAAARAPRGSHSLAVTDWSTGEPHLLEVPLDPAKSPKEQVEAMFHRARRLKRGAVIAAERLAQATAMTGRLREVLEAVHAAATLPAIEEHFSQARAAAPRDVSAGEGSASPQAGAPRGKQPKGTPYRTFTNRSGERILVGKGAAQNDTLTFQIARPHDLWLHVKGLTGAHVLVPLAKTRECPPELLIDAAHLAAHFSDARGEAVVDVQYVARKYVRKPRGGAPGLVTIEREKVVGVRLEPSRLKALLEAEESAT